MSTSYLMGAREDGVVRKLAEYGNAWGNHPMIWSALSEKYKHEFGYTGNPFMDWSLMQEWAVNVTGGRLKEWEKNVLYMTFDGFYLHGKEDAELYAESLDMFSEALSVPDRICHLGRIAEDVRGLSSQGVQYFMWYGSSVNANPWQIASPDDERNCAFNMLEDIDKRLYDSKKTAVRFVPGLLSGKVPASHG